MKKLISLLLALTLVFSLALSVAAAESDYTNSVTEPGTSLGTNVEDSMTTVTLYMCYKSIGTSAKSPEETFTFTVTTGWTEDGTPVYVTDSPLTSAPDFASGNNTVSIKLKSGAATSEGAYYPVTFTLPTYTAVGIYHYTITQSASTNGGVTADTEPIHLVVTVQNVPNTDTTDNDQDFNKFVVAAIHAERGENAEKTWIVNNTYEANELDVEKLVTGNLGDETKYFDVTITLIGEDGKTYTQNISAQDSLGNDIAVYNKSELTSTNNPTDSYITISSGTDSTTSGLTLHIKHGETIKVTNIPEGVTYKVSEATYTDDNGGYDAAIYLLNRRTYPEGTESSNTQCATTAQDFTGEHLDKITIVNNKGVTVDTGVVLDSAPYIVLLAVAVIGLAVVIIKKRQARDY